MKGYSYRINRDLFSLSFNNNTEEKHGWDDKSEWSHYPILDKVLNFMKTRGFEVGSDPEIDKNYKCLSKDHWYGIKKDLEFKAHRYPSGWEIEFYQNISFENRHGGFYDFDKFEKAPYLIRLLFIKEIEYIGEFIENTVKEVKCYSEKDYKLAEEKIKKDFQRHFDNKITMDFDLSKLDGLEGDAEYRRDNRYQSNCKDRDGKIIVNGSIKYFRDYKGRLQRGKVYHNINNMWWVVLNDTDYTNEAAFSLLDPTEEDFKNRRIQRNAKDSFETSTKAARKYFIKKGLSYSDINRSDIEKLHEVIGKEIDKGSCIETMKINPKIKTRCKGNKKIVHAYLFVDAHYFTKRECISFNPDGFIGFAGWAGSETVRPIIKGFVKWCDYLTENKTA